jgi:3-hydroxybutyryl-CoA dehydrogenase
MPALRRKPGGWRLAYNTPMSTQSFSSAVVIGTGMMGPGIAVSLARGGIRSTIVSRTAQGAAAGLEKARRQLKLLADNGLGMQAPAELISASDSIDDVVHDADLVVESGPESMPWKQEMFEYLDSNAKPDALLASNTSGLSITDIASRCKHPERVLTAHFWNPPHLMPLVEVVAGARTDQARVEALVAQLRLCGKVAIPVRKDTPGQLGNRMQAALVREAVHIVAQGIADAESVDLAARYGFGLRLPVYGVLEHQDIVGLDLAFAVSDYVTQDLNCEPHGPALMREMIAKGQLGAKSGQGFYDWSKRSADEARARRDSFVLEFLKRHPREESPG